MCAFSLLGMNFALEALEDVARGSSLRVLEREVEMIVSGTQEMAFRRRFMKP